MDVQLIRLTAEWAEAFRNIRHEALQTFPLTFAYSYEQESVYDLAHYAEQLHDNYAYGAIHEGELIATAALWPEGGASMKHKATMKAVYVKPEWQGKGLAKQLVTHMMQEAAKHFEQVNLMVDSVNHAAIAVYESLGFERLGFEPRARKYGDSYYDDLWMVAYLKREGQ